MVRLALASLVLAGCHIGAGPIIAYSATGGFRFGLEASGGAAFVRGSVGNTWSVSGQPSRFYLTAEPGAVYPFSQLHSSYRRLFLLGGGATIGMAWGSDNSGLAVGGWATGGTTVDHLNCQDGYPTFSIAIGYRVLAGVDELFLAPKISTFTVPAPCT